jgi:hypothetical protein
MTVPVLDRALVAGDAGGVTGEQERPDPEVPERARRRSFTAQYKLDVVAEYDAAATTRSHPLRSLQAESPDRAQLGPWNGMVPKACSTSSN